jgi:uncharacterized protein (DUF983 family)
VQAAGLPPARSRIAAILLQRCPRCREGRMFRGMFAMNDPCPVCGLVFEREPGYFFGAMYFSYAIAVAILIPAFFLLQALLPGRSDFLIAFLAALIYLPLAPMVFRYSRVLWVAFDRAVSPSELSTHAPRLKGTAPKKDDQHPDNIG